MGCAASSSTAEEPHQKTVITVASPQQYPVTQTSAVLSVQQTQAVNVQNRTVHVTNIPDAPKGKKRKDSSSSSSSSDSDSSVDLDKQRKEIKERKAVLTKDTLLRYHSLSTVIFQLERKNITLKLEEKVRLSAELKSQAQTLNEEYRNLRNKTDKELQDVQNLQSLAAGTNVFKYFESQTQFDTQMSKEQEEYIQAKTEMEDCYNRISALQSRQSVLESQIATLNVDNQELVQHYKEQDEILNSIFGGAYGSDLEDQLESELDKKLEKKQRIDVVYQRWREADSLVKQASTQLNYAYDRWTSIQRISFSSMQNKMVIVQVAAQARAYLIAASQNLRASQGILHHVKFPYCDKSEIVTLNKAISYIFIDVQTKERHAHAGDVYRTTRDRCYVLAQWMQHVISKDVVNYVEQSRNECAELSAKLRTERIRLMREKIEQETGQKVAFDVETDSGIDTEEDEPVPVAAEAEKVAEDRALDEQIKDAEKDVVEGENGETVETNAVDKPVPLPLDELAPNPKQDELLGNLEAVMAEYDKQRDEYSREMEANRARQHADLQMKLQARRSRKRRMMAQKQELDEMVKKEQQLAAIEIPQSA